MYYETKLSEDQYKQFKKNHYLFTDQEWANTVFKVHISAIRDAKQRMKSEESATVNSADYCAEMQNKSKKNKDKS